MEVRTAQPRKGHGARTVEISAIGPALMTVCTLSIHLGDPAMLRAQLISELHNASEDLPEDREVRQADLDDARGRSLDLLEDAQDVLDNARSLGVLEIEATADAVLSALTDLRDRLAEHELT